MRRKKIIPFLLLFFTASVEAHDLFLKLDTYHLLPNSMAVVRLLNGTFQNSEGVVARERMRDISVLAPDLRKPFADSVKWRNQNQTTVMEFQTGGPGTYVVGVSTNPKEISLKAAEFNDYLAHDGLPDILETRKKDQDLDKDVRERYSKHVRAIFQVGLTLSDDYKRQLNYPVEIIPQLNPYSLHSGQTLPLLCTIEGGPLVNQFVIAGWETTDGKLQTLSSRTNASGIVRFKLTAPGKWYVKLIYMRPISDPGLDYESKWATVTFEIRDKNLKKE
ncbi:MAG TPA: DUF4198 domain-containing protein [Pyrinomonadaceae bacterium]|nr:DUF4198 domain-containing protein [Pyrinomonadaceae bacterium]